MKLKHGNATSFIARRWNNVEELYAEVIAAETPDFSVAYDEFKTLDLVLPDDPMSVGLDATKAMLAKITNLRMQIAQKRVAAIYLQSEWRSARYASELFLEQLRSKEIFTPEYADLKNKESRDAYMNCRVDTAFTMMLQALNIAVTRCTDFAEACSTMTSALEAMQLSLSRQITIIEHQFSTNPMETN